MEGQLSRTTRHRFTHHVVAYGASATSDQYHLAFRQLEGEERLVGINDGDPASNWFVPFTSPAPSRAVMALNPAPGWHLLTLVSDVAQKRSTLFLNGEKWGVAAGAAGGRAAHELRLQCIRAERAEDMPVRR